MGAVWYSFDEKILGNTSGLSEGLSANFSVRYDDSEFAVGDKSQTHVLPMGCSSHMYSHTIERGAVSWHI